jgi:protein phosphatase
MRLRAAGISDRGLIRDNNEDAFLIDVDRGLFCVSDGMGGLDAGEVASALALRTLADRLPHGGGSPTLERPVVGAPWWKEAADRLEAAIHAANQAILDESRGRFGAAGPSRMGATLVGLSRCEQGFILANVGDSRAYVSRAGVLSQLSDDHSLVMAQVRQGFLTREQARLSPERHVIYRALGMTDEVEVDLSPVAAKPGDLYLLCSDGLTDVTGDEVLSDILSAGDDGPLEATCRRLLDEALARQSRDNVTVVLVRVDAL